MKKHFFTNLFIFFIVLSVSKNSEAKSTKNKILKTIVANTVKPGADNLEAYLPLLKGKKIGVVTNQTAVVNSKKGQIHLIDFLLEQKIDIQTVFAPEHGFRGTADAGEHINDFKDTKTGLPIISIYGNNKKPKPEQLTKMDALIFDIQDVGVRFYTFISSLHYVMEACAENNIPLIILDRPNPNGTIIDGPVLEKEYTSFVGMHPVPVLYGMTIGEYAKMINGEKWLNNGIQCNINVVPCVNYKRNMEYSLPVKPSPNLPNNKSINLYASLCLFEGTNVSCGRGTEKQFQIYGSPFLSKEIFNFNFTPKPNFGAKDPMHNGILCYGEDLSNVKIIKQFEIKWLIKAYQNTEDKTKFFNSFFTKLAGNKKLQNQIENNVPEKEIKASWQENLSNFKTIRNKYLIY